MCGKTADDFSCQNNFMRGQFAILKKKLCGDCNLDTCILYREWMGGIAFLPNAVIRFWPKLNVCDHLVVKLGNFCLTKECVKTAFFPA